MQITHAEEVAIGPAKMTIRNPVAVWILSFVTLGIWAVVWTYQVTRELRDYSQAVTRPFSASPIVAATLAAMWPLAFVPGMIGAFVNARRVRTVQDWVESPGRAHGTVAALLFPLLFAHTVYLQGKLNDVWRRAREGHGPPPDFTAATGRQQRTVDQAQSDALSRDLHWR
jgi:Domain of unknown function (DUF4234)